MGKEKPTGWEASRDGRGGNVLHDILAPGEQKRFKSGQSADSSQTSTNHVLAVAKMVGDGKRENEMTDSDPKRPNCKDALTRRRQVVGPDS